jgi:transcriptional regulator with XRE-family HTH domain
MSTTKPQSVFSTRLAQAIRENKFTQSEFADRCGLTKMAMSHYVLGRRHPDIDIVVRMADHLSISLDWLFGRDSYAA